MKHFIKLYLALTLLVTAALSAQGATIFVRTTGNDANSGASAALAKLTIANAIAAAASGDIIDIGAGTYDQGENPLSINKNLTLRGPYATTAGYGSTRNVGFIVAGNGSEAVITGAAPAPYHYGLSLIVVGAPATDVVIEGLTLTTYDSYGNFSLGTVYSTNGGNFTLRYCRIVCDGIGYDLGAICIERYNSFASIIIDHNHFFGVANSTIAKFMELEGKVSITLTENVIEKGAALYASYGVSSASNSSSTCTVSKNVFKNLSIVGFSGFGGMLTAIMQNDFLHGAGDFRYSDGDCSAICTRGILLEHVNGTTSISNNRFDFINGNRGIWLYNVTSPSGLAIHNNLADGGTNCLIYCEGPSAITVDATYNVWGPNGTYGPGGGNAEVLSDAAGSTFAAQVVTSPHITACPNDLTPTSYTNAGIIGAGYQPETPLPAPANVTVTTPTVTSLNVNWDAISGISQYRIGYRVSGATTYTYTAPVTPNVVTGQPARRFRTLTGLQAGTTYEIVVQAYSATAVCPPANSVIATGSTTPPGLVTCPTPTGVYAEVVGSTVSFNWTPGNNAVGTILAYGPGTLFNTTVVTANNNYSVGGLAAGTYAFRLRSNCVDLSKSSNQLSTYSPVVYFTVGGAPRNGEETNVLTSVTPSLSVYPNPSRGTFTLNADGIEENTPVQIFDMTGKIIYQTATIENGETNFDLSDKPAGVYLIKAGEKSLKIIKE